MTAPATDTAETVAPEAMLTVPEVAAMLRLSVGTVYRLAQTGALPAHKPGGRWRFWEHEVKQAINNTDPWRRSNQARARRRSTRRAA